MSPNWPLRTERLLLRPYEPSDFDALLGLQSNVEVVRWLYNEPRTPEDTRRLLGVKLAGHELVDEGKWLSCVVEADGVYVGDISLHWLSVEHKTAEVGFMFDPRHQGKGYA